VSQIDDLIAAMTLPEKLGQLTMTTASYAVTGPVATTDLEAGIRTGQIGNVLNLYGPDAVRGAQRLALEATRLKIPLLVGMDVIHGHRTLFPIPLGETALFDPAAWEATAREAAREAAADGVHLTFAPMLDVARDPRWGRIAEGPGEDPLVGGALARAKVKGFQGQNLTDPVTLAGCAKHYCAYGAVKAGREYAETDVSQRALREIYLPPFEAAVAAGVATIMPAFTDLDGVPMTANSALLKDYLRDRLHFEGVLISDYNAIAELIRHGVAADLAEAAALALKAGVDMDMMANAYRDGLPVALERGLVTMADIDTSVRRVLILKEQLGLFDNPYGRGSIESPDVIAARRRLARDVGARSVVMLKNAAQALPILGGKIAVIGPLANDRTDMRGCWWAAGRPEDCVSVLDGLRTALPGQEIGYALGVGINDDEESGIADALALCGGADTIILCLGESATMNGEACSRAHPGLPGKQKTLADAVMARAQNKRVIVILFSGRPLVVPEIVSGASAVLAAWAPGSEAGNALADVLLGKVSPSGKTPVSWPRAVGQIPIFYNERRGGRPANPDDHYTSKYLDELNAPLFPFGHGLSYGDFVYADLNVSPAEARETDSFIAKVTLINHGLRQASETVFLFIHDKVAQVSRPLLELKGFDRISLRPGESGIVTFTLPAAALKFPGLDFAPLYEPGEIEILAGPSADRSRMLSVTVRLV
jgi:beta-glucosidase